jgi:hypothetical protein
VLEQFDPELKVSWMEYFAPSNEMGRRSH